MLERLALATLWGLGPPASFAAEFEGGKTWSAGSVCMHLRGAPPSRLALVAVPLMELGRAISIDSLALRMRPSFPFRFSFYSPFNRAETHDTDWGQMHARRWGSPPLDSLASRASSTAAAASPAASRALSTWACCGRGSRRRWRQRGRRCLESLRKRQLRLQRDWCSFNALLVSRALGLLPRTAPIPRVRARL